jgi:uncharacterized membrane protein
MIRISDALSMIVILLFAWSVYKAQKNPNFAFDLFDLVMENGKVSKLAVVFLGAFATMSWVIIRLTIDGKLTDVYYAAYGAIWVAPLITRLFSPPK